MATINVSLPSDGDTIDAADYNTPVNTIVNEINGNLDNANIKSAAAIAGSKLADNSIDIEAKASTDSGWRKVTDAWSYASATTVTVPTDATTKYSPGDRIKFVQTTTKYFTIISLTGTILTLQGKTGVTVANAAISDIYYSKSLTPVGHIGFITNPFIFRAWDSATTSLTDGAVVTINLGTEVYDYNNNFAANTYTAPFAGVWHFDGCVAINGVVATGVSAFAIIYVNGAEVARGARAVPGNDFASCASTDLLLASGDAVTLRFFQDSAGVEFSLAGAHTTYFSGHLLHAL